MEKEQWFTEMFEALGVTEKTMDDDDRDLYLVTPEGQLILYTYWTYYPVDSRFFAQHKNIYKKYTKKQLEQIVKNLPAVIKHLDAPQDFDDSRSEFLGVFGYDFDKYNETTKELLYYKV